MREKRDRKVFDKSQLRAFHVTVFYFRFLFSSQEKLSVVRKMDIVDTFFNEKKNLNQKES